jgi:hypothetical protein
LGSSWLAPAKETPVLLLAESAHFGMGLRAQQPCASTHGCQQSSSNDHAVMFHLRLSTYASRSFMTAPLPGFVSSSAERRCLLAQRYAAGGDLIQDKFGPGPGTVAQIGNLPFRRLPFGRLLAVEHVSKMAPSEQNWDDVEA